MVATVGSISIDLSTNAVKFADGFKRSATTVDRESARMAKAIAAVERASSFARTAVAGFVGGIVAGGALAALTSLTGALGKARQALSDFEAIGNSARTAGLSTDTFQALALGAQQADIEQQNLNSALEIFAKNVGLAKEGTGALFSGLKQLNPELLRAILGARDQEQRLRLVGDALNKTADATKRAALETAIFGRSAVGISRIFEKSIDEWRRIGAEMGIIVPKDLIERSGQLGDQLDLLATVVNVNLSQALVHLAPLLVVSSVAAANFAKSFNEVTAAVNEFINNPSWAAFDELRKKFVTVEFIPGTLAGDIANAFTGTAGSVAELQKQIDEVEREIAATTKGIKELKEAGAVDIDILPATQNLESLWRRYETLKARLEEQLTINVDTSAAKAKIADLAQAFRASELASMRALDRFNVSANAAGATTGSSLSDLANSLSRALGIRPGALPGALPSASGLPRVTSYSRTDFADLEEAAYAGADQVSDGLSELSTDIRDYFGNAVYELGSDIRSTNDLLGKSINYHFATLVDGVRTGIVSGMAEYDRQRYSISNNYDAYAEQFDSYAGRMRDTDYDYYAGQFAGGGSFTVGGNQTGDSTRVMFDANDGERVTVTPRNESPATVVLNYHAAPGESERTARQNARAMLEMLQRETARA